MTFPRLDIFTSKIHLEVERYSLVVDWRIVNRESSGSTPPLLPFQKQCIFILCMTPQFTQLYKCEPGYIGISGNVM